MLTSGFAGFDVLGGGFARGQSYLVHGPQGAGKTTFALQFLLAGLQSGEEVALVARRSAPLVLEKALAFGFDLRPFVRDGRLALFEYAPRVIESCARLREEREVVEELRAGVGSPRSRIVLDPVTPLLAGTQGGGAAFRARGLTQEFARLGATTMLLGDTPEDHEVVAAFRDLVFGSLRLEPATDAAAARLVPEQLPGARLDVVEFEVERGQGLVPARPRAAASGAEARTLLLILVDAAERERLSRLLGTEHRVEAIADAAEGLARMSAVPPDLVLVDREAGSIGGTEFCRKLRANGVNVPIILLADPVRRVRDRVALLDAGADECLERPVDPRLLRLRVRGLLSRYDAKRDRLARPRPAEVAAGNGARDAAVTQDPERFLARVEDSVGAAAGSGLPFSVVAVRPAPGESLRSVAGTVERVVREYDLVYLGHEIALVLLAEADERGTQAFLDRLARAGATGSTQETHRCFDPAGSDGEGIVEWVRERLAPTGPVLARIANA